MQDGGVAKDVNIFFIFIIVYVVLHNVCGTTSFVVAYIVPLCMTVNTFDICFHSYVRVRCLPFGCVV